MASTVLQFPNQSSNGNVPTTKTAKIKGQETLPVFLLQPLIKIHQNPDPEHNLLGNMISYVETAVDDRNFSKPRNRNQRDKGFVGNGNRALIALVWLSVLASILYTPMVKGDQTTPLCNAAFCCRQCCVVASSLLPTLGGEFDFNTCKSSCFVTVDCNAWPTELQKETCRAAVAFGNGNNEALATYDYDFTGDALGPLSMCCLGNSTSKELITGDDNTTARCFNPKNPTKSPSSRPTTSPSRKPTRSPTPKPTLKPTTSPTNKPSLNPTTSPTRKPTLNPTITPNAPTDSPSATPSFSPTRSPSISPTKSPSVHDTPTKAPVHAPTKTPSSTPTISPSLGPTFSPSTTTSASPSESPSKAPTLGPIITQKPTISPSSSPSSNPIASPTGHPSISFSPTLSPTASFVFPGGPVAVSTPPPNARSIDAAPIIGLSASGLAIIIAIIIVWAAVTRKRRKSRKEMSAKSLGSLRDKDPQKAYKTKSAGSSLGTSSDQRLVVRALTTETAFEHEMEPIDHGTPAPEILGSHGQKTFKRSNDKKLGRASPIQKTLPRRTTTSGSIDNGRTSFSEGLPSPITYSAAVGHNERSTGTDSRKTNVSVASITKSRARMDSKNSSTGTLEELMKPRKSHRVQHEGSTNKAVEDDDGYWSQMESNPNRPKSIFSPSPEYSKTQKRKKNKQKNRRNEAPSNSDVSKPELNNEVSSSAERIILEDDEL